MNRIIKKFEGYLGDKKVYEWQLVATDLKDAPFQVVCNERIIASEEQLHKARITLSKSMNEFLFNEIGAMVCHKIEP